MTSKQFSTLKSLSVAFSRVTIDINKYRGTGKLTEKEMDELYAEEEIIREALAKYAMFVTGGETFIPDEDAWDVYRDGQLVYSGCGNDLGAYGE